MIDEYRLVVLGMGYVGLTLAAVNAKVGFSVVGVDPNEVIISQLKKHNPHFHENGLVELLKEVEDSLEFVTEIPATKSNENSIFVIAVGTSLTTNGDADYCQLDSAIEDIAKVIKSGDVVVLRSTVIAGTTNQRVIPMLEKLTGFTVGNEIFVGFAPERTIEGKAIEELRTLPQVVAASSSAGTRIISDFFSKVSQEVITVDTLESAEMVKLISNSYRDLTFAFSNSIALAASKHNVDVYELITAANQNYERNHIPLPSPGVGGYCLTKDPYLYAQGCSENKDIMNLMHAGRIINSAMPKHVADIADSFIRHLGISDVTVVVVGLAFKSSPPTSDVRFSPSIELVKELQNAGIDDIYAYDPHVLSNVYTEHGIKEIEQFEDAITCGDIIVFMHGDQMYADKNVLDVLRKRKGEQLLIDTWGLFAGKIKSSVHGVDYANLSYKTF